MNNNFNLVDSSLFNHPKLGKLQVLVDEQGEPWFIAKEVAVILGYNNPSEAVLEHVKPKHRKSLIFKAYSKSPISQLLWNGNDFSNKLIINEPGVYELIMNSYLPSASDFQDWVTEEVLPSIRKYGHYDINQPQRLDSTDAFDKMMKVLQANMAMFDALNEEHHCNLKKIEVLTPKAEYTDKVLSVPDCLTTTTIAKDLGMAAKRLNKILHQKKIEFCQAGTWHLYSDFQNKGLADLRTYTFGEDDAHCRESLVWTQKGRSFIINIVQKGMTPGQALRATEELGKITETWNTDR